MVAHEIKKALDEISVACETICGADKCKICPLKSACFEDYALVDAVNRMDDVLISRMLCMAEIITERQEEAEKTEYDRKWEHEADEWLLRKAELDDE